MAIEHRFVTLSSVAALVTGCAQLPDADVQYYLPKSQVSFKVVRTVACDATNHIIVTNSVTPIVRHAADATAGPERIHLKELKGPFSDTDITFDFYDDGRLKSINSINTGQGEMALKAIITAGARFARTFGDRTYPDQCKFINAASDKNGLTLIYEGEVPLAKRGPNEPLVKVPVDLGSAPYANELKSVIGEICAEYQGSLAPASPVIANAVNSGAAVTLRQPGIATFRVEICGATFGDSVIWTGTQPVAQHGTTYKLPMVKPSAFGKQVLKVDVHESGALTKVQYSSNTGAGQAAGVVDALLTARQTGNEQIAKELKAEIDVIIQQQRLSACLANKDNCK